jgi:gas vesicle protein
VARELILNRKKHTIMKKVLLILLAGVAVGMLLAPEKGSETWNKIVDGLDDIKDKAIDEINSLVGKSKDIASKGKQTVQKASKVWE